MLRTALAAFFAALGFATAAFAQDDYVRGDTVGEFLQRQRQDNVAIDPRQRPPRFIVEAVSFTALDETHYSWMGSDSIYAHFYAMGRGMFTRNVDVDSGDTERFLSTQSCILPAADPDRRRNGQWRCDPAGAPGPIEFEVTLREDDAVALPPFGFSVCAAGSPEYRGTDLDRCDDSLADDGVLSATMRYEAADIIARLRPDCRCFVETLTSNNDDSRYRFVFRVTMVDPGGGPTLEQGPVGGGGGGPTGPTVHRTGTLSVPNGLRLELDAGTVVTSAGDFVFAESGGQYRLTPASGARIWPGNATARGYAGCAAGAANHTTNVTQLPPAGSHACYITSDGRVGELRVVEVNDPPFGMPPTLTVSYTTWNN